MPKIGNAARACKVRDKMRTQHEKLINRRAVVDREMHADLDSFGAGLPERLKTYFYPFQTQDPDDEARNLKHILVSNAYELQLASQVRDSSILNRIQNLEVALEATVDYWFTPDIQLDECDFIKDGWVVVVLDREPTGAALAGYGDRAALDAYADSDEPDDDDAAAPRMRYRAAKRAAQGDGDKAYTKVTNDARRLDGMRYCARVPDSLTVDVRLNKKGQVISYIEYGKVPLDPLLKLLGGRIERQGDRFIEVTDEKSYRDRDPLDAPMRPIDNEHDEDDDDIETVNVTYIRTLDEFGMLVEHIDGGDETDRGAWISYDNPTGGRSTLAYVLPADKRNHGDFEDRHQPAILGKLVMAEVTNRLLSATIAMALEEATRPVYQLGQQPPGKPMDAGAPGPKRAPTKPNQAPTLLAGELKRVDTLGLNLIELQQLFNEMGQRFDMDEFFAGTGSAGEPALHLARLQTAALTKLAPYQARRARLRRDMLEDFLAAIVYEGKPVYVPHMPQETRPRGDKPLVVEPYEITPEDARLPITISCTIGAESPETKYAKEQASRAEVDFGARSMLTHMEAMGTKDPMGEFRRMLKSNIAFALLGTPQEPGTMATMIVDLLNVRAKERIDAAFPPPPPAVPELPPGPAALGAPGASGLVDQYGAPMMGGTASGIGAVPPGAARFNPPVQNVGGVPVAPGAMPMPQQ